MPTRTITVLNIKGGVGKTTTVVNLAAGLALRDRRVLVVDMDPQANATYALIGTTQPEASIRDVLGSGRTALSEAIVSSRTAGVDVAPSHVELATLELGPDSGQDPDRTRVLAKQLGMIRGYDYVFIDTPPSLGLMSVSSITAADEVFIPVSPGTFALLGINLLKHTLAEVKERQEVDTPVVSGVILTLFDRTRVAMDTEDILRDHFGALLFDTHIPKYKDFPESLSRSLSIFDYAPDSKAAAAYRALTEEVIDAES